ncbi:hypothetical protein KXS11_09595 [Plantibacter flavus]
MTFTLAVRDSSPRESSHHIVTLTGSRGSPEGGSADGAQRQTPSWTRFCTFHSAEGGCVNLDHGQQGLGSASCSPALPDRYRVPVVETTFAVRLRSLPSLASSEPANGRFWTVRRGEH